MIIDWFVRQRQLVKEVDTLERWVKALEAEVERYREKERRAEELCEWEPFIRKHKEELARAPEYVRQLAEGNTDDQPA